MSIQKILICDDSIAVHESISAYLKSDGFDFSSAFDGEEALKKVKDETFDLIILDIMMPKIIGTEVCKEIRKTSDVPIIMLTAKGEEIDRILGLEIGADDYIVKPFSPREVLARIKTILKRVTPKENKNQNRLIFPNLIVDLEKYEIFIAGEKIEFTPKEVEIIYLLANSVGKVLTREHILNKIWGYDYFGDTRAVDTQVKRIRKKFPEEDLGFDIKSIYGVGYKFEVTK